MESASKSMFGILIFLTILLSVSFVSATIDTVIINYNSDNINYNYSVIGRSYDLYVSGTNLTQINDSELEFVRKLGENTFQYKFTPGNIAGLRTFGTGENQFNLSVLSEADELSNSIGSVIINITDDSSSINVNDFSLENKIVRMLNVSDVADLNIDYLLDLNLLLNGLTFDLNFNKGSAYPQYNSVNINSSPAITVIENLIRFNNLPSYMTVDEINTGHFEYLNELIDAYGANITYPSNSRVVKEGNNFEFFSDDGYSTLNRNDLENAQEIINEKIKYINPDEVINELLPLGNFSEFKKFVDFNVSVDFGNLEILESGTYNLTLIYTDKYGNNGTMPFIVNLNVTNVGYEESVDSNGTVTFTSPVVNQTLERIENLPQNITITPILYGVNKPSGFAGLPQNVHSLNFMQINSSNDSKTNNGSYSLYFRILTSSIDSNYKDNVSLYIQEGNSWIKLPTILINETSEYYMYNSTIPHFSNYLIGYYQESVSSGGGSSSGGSSGGGSSSVGSSRTTKPISLISEPTSPKSPAFPSEPLNLSNPSDNPSGLFGITGAAIGALSSPGGIGIILFVLILLALLIILRIKRRENKKKSSKKLNSGGDGIGEK